MVPRRFRDSMCESWAIGPFARADGAHYDETDCVSELFDGGLQGSVMIDVGAHTGHSLFPFMEQGWRVFAFEHDDRTSAILETLLPPPDSAGFRVRLVHRAVVEQVSSRHIAMQP